MEKLRNLGFSAFLARAIIDDQDMDKPRGFPAYHADPEELLARVGEASLSKAIGASNIATRSTAFSLASLPMAGELEQASALYFDWLAAARPLLESSLRTGSELSELREATPMGAFSKMVGYAVHILSGSPKPPEQNHGAEHAQAQPPKIDFGKRKTYSTETTANPHQPPSLA
jgi:hypothetical protein